MLPVLFDIYYGKDCFPFVILTCINQWDSKENVKIIQNQNYFQNILYKYLLIKSNFTWKCERIFQVLVNLIYIWCSSLALKLKEK